MEFSQLSLIEPLLRALRDEGYTKATPIQERAIPHVLAGRDLLGCAQTGTGKTAAFALPILQRLSQSPPVHGRPVRVLVLSPTRELAAQIGESFRAYGRHLKMSSTVIFGGVGQHPQEQALRRGVEILVATPGRLLDLMGQGIAKLNAVEVLVLDEADRMLDMGFIHDIRRILQVVPKKRQTLFFSATMPREIRQLADSMLHDPVSVEVAPESTAAETVRQSVYFVSKMDKPALLEHLLSEGDVTRVLVFTRTKHGADKVAKHLTRSNIIAEAIHGNKSQNARTRALDNFKKGSTRVLVASDIASRGLDVDEISHVINFDLPNEPETYVHRIGRTGRAGASGTAMSFCDGEERAFLRDIERTIRKPVPVIDSHPFAGRAGQAAPARDASGQGQHRGGQGGHGGYQGNRGQQRDGRRDGRRSEGGRTHGGDGARRDYSARSEPVRASGDTTMGARAVKPKTGFPARRGGPRSQW